MAIAFDAQSSGFGSALQNIVTISHTITGSNPVLIVFPYSAKGGGGAPITSVTWNTTENLSQITSEFFVADNVYQDCWVLANPTTGTHNIVITTVATTRLGAACVSYTGVNQASAVGASGDAQGSSGTGAVTITTDTNNSYIVGCVWTNGNDPTIDASMTSRVEYQDSGSSTYQNAGDKLVATAGSSTAQWTFSSTDWIATAIEIHAAGGASVNGNFLAIL